MDPSSDQQSSSLSHAPHPDERVSEPDVTKFPRIPTRADFLRNQLKQRRYFDSGDYAMSKAGKKPEPGQEIGSEHPQPANIPHRSALLAHANASPVRRHSQLVQETEKTDEMTSE